MVPPISTGLLFSGRRVTLDVRTLNEISSLLSSKRVFELNVLPDQEFTIHHKSNWIIPLAVDDFGACPDLGSARVIYGVRGLNDPFKPPMLPILPRLRSRPDPTALFLQPCHRSPHSIVASHERSSAHNVTTIGCPQPQNRAVADVVAPGNLSQALGVLLAAVSVSRWPRFLVWDSDLSGAILTIARGAGCRFGGSGGQRCG